MNVLEATFEKLKGLPDDKIKAVSSYIDSLNNPHSGPFDDLSGCMDPSEVRKMEMAITNAFEQIDEY